jgi:hypothetical protein
MEEGALAGRDRPERGQDEKEEEDEGRVVAAG